VDMAVEKKKESSSEARALRKELFSDELLDRLMSRVDEDGVALTGQGGFLPELVKAVLERGMDAELSGHLGYERGDRAGHGSGNSPMSGRLNHQLARNGQDAENQQPSPKLSFP
jgi:putative transposase